MPYSRSTNWKQLVKNKWLIFDTDAVISLIEFNATDVLEKMKSSRVVFSYIHPVLLEIMNTDSEKKAIERSELLDRYDFIQLPLTKNETNLATKIQNSLPVNLKCQPSATDFYLGGTLAKYAESKKAFLLTSNTKDFPQPIYTRENFIILTNAQDVKCISIIGVNTKELLD